MSNSSTKDTKKLLNKKIIAYFVIILMIGTIFPIVHSNPTDPWWKTEWTYRKEITIDHNKVSANLVNFPVLINIQSDEDLANQVQSNGNDIVFTDKNGNKLNHEIELYESSTGRLVAWVNIPGLSSISDTIIYLYYGNSQSGYQQNPQQTWNSDYLMVHHMNETGNLVDSTSHALNAVNSGTITESNGQIDGCRYFDGTSDSYNFGTSALLNPGMNSWTISLWTKIAYNDSMMLRKWGSNAGFFLWTLNGWGGYNYFRVSDGIKSAYRYWDTSFSDGSWHYVTAVINRNTNNIDLYLDGALHNGNAAGSLTGMGSISSSANFLLYGRTNGMHDEFIISTTVRNASWIKTSYNNQNDPSGFYSLGSEEQGVQVNRAPTFSNPSPSDGSTLVNRYHATNVAVSDLDGNETTVCFWYSTSNSPYSWIKAQQNNSVAANTTVRDINSSYSSGWNTQYWWKVTAYDGYVNSSVIYTFRTKSQSVINKAPIVFSELPKNDTAASSFQSSVSVIIQDPDGDKFDWSITGPYVVNAGETGDLNGTKTADLNLPLPYGTEVVWSVHVRDLLGSGKWTNRTYHFTILSSVLPTINWNKNPGIGISAVGPLAADVNNDGKVEIIRTGGNGIAILDGATGAIIKTKFVHMWDDHCPMEIIDLNKDGILEIITSHENGTWALHGDDLSVYWDNPDAPLHNKYCVVGDIGTTSGRKFINNSPDGYPEVFVCTIGSIHALTHDGKIFAEAWTYYPCFGGLTLGDTDNDSIFELYQGDRSASYHDNGVGRGCVAFWASNLTERWSHPEMLMSSSCPTLVDVNNDGKLDVVCASQIPVGFCVYNSTNGENMSVDYPTDYLPRIKVHSQTTIYDVDNDGNLEMITCRDWSKPIIWDLVLRQVDAWLPYDCFEPPAVADIDGDGDVEIIACGQYNISLFTYVRYSNNHYQLIGNITLSNPGYGMSIMVAQDVDNDSKIELVFNRGSSVYVYDTIGPAPNPRALSQFNFYSQHRGRAPYYIPFRQ